GELGLALLLGLLGEARAEDLQRGLLVRRLAALVLDRDDDVRRQMGDPDGGVRLVHVLAAGAGRAERVDAQVALVELDSRRLVEERRDDHLRQARVTPARLVYPTLPAQPAPRVPGLPRSPRVLYLGR